jgi:hypothetical protein
MTIPVLPSLDRNSPTFRDEVDTFFGTQLPAFSSALDDVMPDIQTAAAIGPVISASANFAGNWSALAGALTVPVSVYHNGAFWQLLNDIPNAALSEPGVSGDWAAMQNVSTGDMLQTLRPIGAPDWVPCDGGTYLKSAYAALGALASGFGFVAPTIKTAGPSALPAGNARGCTFSPDGTYLAVAHYTTPFITIYKRSGDTFTKLANPSALPANAATGFAFSPDGNYLAVAHEVTPFITIYKRSGDTFTKLSNPSALPASTANGCAFSPDGNYLAVAHSGTPFITIYKRSGDTFTKLSNPSALPANNAYDCTFSPDGNYLAVAHSGTPFITIYGQVVDSTTQFRMPLVDSPVPAYLKA